LLGRHDDRRHRHRGRHSGRLRLELLHMLKLLTHDPQVFGG
jgi:hypothetical protein